MKTEISQFCQEYAKILRPFDATLRESLAEIREKQDSDALKRSISGFADTHHRLNTLLDKVEDQEAFVIIFGPLKSGKSTLMNAISAAYVSEVTSLPAYPCLVHVRHDPETRIVAKKFSGETENFPDNSTMRKAIADHHAHLASHIRKIEEGGETFDPGIHYPEAIRRIDIGLPAKNLEDSYTVLVDTPGLYSRMKFGYDLMTREFRDSAACAVFVVKTDNLFLEQVFDEFNDLLNLFSRIFLVVNIDANKKDLGPDGELIPSLESQDPEKIIDAFCSLSMSAPMRNAFDEGRLHIYPIDLLHAAANSLSPESSQAGEEQASEEQVGEEGYSDITETPEQKKPSGEPFDTFLQDLTDYLNSNDYLLNFIFDSLRQGKTLTAEVRENCSADSLRDFHERQASLEYELKEERSRRSAVSSLDEQDWSNVFGEVQRGTQEATEEISRNEKKQLESKLNQIVTDWFESDESLRELLFEKIEPAFAASLKNVANQCRQKVEEMTNTAMGGVDVSPDLIRAFDKVGISLLKIRQETSASELSYSDQAWERKRNLEANAIPVRKSIWDWILFRTENKVRRRLFGNEQQWDQPIPANKKISKLGETGKAAILSQLQNILEENLPTLPVRAVEGMVKQYVEGFGEGIRTALAKAREELDRKLPLMEQRVKDNEGTLQRIERLKNNASKVEYSIAEIEKSFSHLPAPGSSEQQPSLSLEEAESESPVELEEGDDSLDEEES
ncbi:MAG: dynamin family protein [Opitutales bacterium]|nr:dynamin family protein [Opitutales bacterium]MCH8539549.1 dynamin family protein [Opitutales bacterium]